MKVRFEPSHVVVGDGAQTWTSPDGSGDVGPVMPANLPVSLVERREAWALVECSNTWQAWIDARALVALEPVAEAEQRPPVKVGKVIVSVPLFASLGIMLSTVLTWVGSAPLGLPDKTAYSFPVDLLTDGDAFNVGQGLFAEPGGLTIGVAVLVLGLAAAVLSQTDVNPMVARVMGWAVLVISTLFVTQLQRGLGQLVVARVFSLLDVGVYLAALSGLVLGLARGPRPARPEQP